MSLTQEEALKPILIRAGDGSIDVINVRGIICDTAMIDGILFNPRNVILQRATIGGITLNNHTISSTSIAFSSADGMIDMGGASLVNVGGIVANSDDYRSVYDPVTVPGTSVGIAGIITLPSGNVIGNVYLTMVAMSTGGLSVSVQLGYKVKKYLGVVTMVLSGYNTVTADDPLLDAVSVSLSSAGGGVLNVNISNPSPIALRCRVVAAVTVLGP